MNTQPLLLPIFFKPPLCLWSLPCIQYSPNPLFPLITSHCEWFTQGPLSLLSIVLIPHLPPSSWLCSLIPNFVHFASTSCIWLCPPPTFCIPQKLSFLPCSLHIANTWPRGLRPLLSTIPKTPISPCSLHLPIPNNVRFILNSKQTLSKHIIMYGVIHFLSYWWPKPHDTSDSNRRVLSQIFLFLSQVLFS